MFGKGDLQDLGKAVARTWLGAARELVGDPDLARQEADLKVVMDREVRELERSVEKAKVRRTEGDILTLSTAIVAYSVDHKKYPAGTPDDLEKLLGTPVAPEDRRRSIWKVLAVDAWLD